MFDGNNKNELSSALAGYLGRVEEAGKKCDRFYYLRDLPI
jgi:hypothetical protein